MGCLSPMNNNFLFLQPIKIDWWPLTRDVSIYICSVILLVVMTWDGVIYWYEGLVLFIAYFLYFTIMFQNPRISRFVKALIQKIQRKGEEKKKSAAPSTSITIIDSSYITHYEEPIKKYVEYKEEESAKNSDNDGKLSKLKTAKIPERFYTQKFKSR